MLLKDEKFISLSKEYRDTNDKVIQQLKQSSDNETLIDNLRKEIREIKKIDSNKSTTDKLIDTTDLIENHTICENKETLCDILDNNKIIESYNKLDDDVNLFG